MESLIESIRIAIATDATEDNRAAGAHACRTILTALEARPGMTVAQPSFATQLGGLVAMMRTLPPDQMLDIAIAQVRNLLPPGVNVPAVAPLKMQLIPIAGIGAP